MHFHVLAVSIFLRSDFRRSCVHVCMQACEYVHVRCFKSVANVDMEAKKGVYMYGLVSACTW